jgi:TfoX/Sxy family transcriptional regulator of competence genes
MALDEDLAERIRHRLSRLRGIEEKKMFGGVAFMLNGHLLPGVWKDCLCVRLGPDESAAALLEPHVRVFDITRRPMKNWVLVEPEGLEEDDQLAGWIQRAEKWVETLPAK